MESKLFEIDRADLRNKENQQKPPVITDVRDVASYNWVPRKIPTIVVPGRPAEWCPPTSDQKLYPSTASPFHDSNSNNYSKHPFEPAITAVSHQHTDYDSTKIDIVGCGSTLTHLLSFACYEKRTFSCRVEKIGNTIFFIRQTDKVENQYPGYKRPFASTFTTWTPNVADSESHQRIISYDFGGLRVMVRYECDAFLPSVRESGFEEAATSSANKRKFEDNTEENDKEWNSTSDVPVTKVEPMRTDARDSQAENIPDQLIVEPAGLKVPREAIIDIKSRSIKLAKPYVTDSIEESFLPRLWLRQIPNLILAFHTKGFFKKQDLRHIETKSKIEGWEKRNQGYLKVFNNLLRELVRIAEEYPCFVLRREGVQPLEVWKDEEKGSALTAATA